MSGALVCPWTSIRSELLLLFHIHVKNKSAPTKLKTNFRTVSIDFYTTPIIVMRAQCAFYRCSIHLLCLCLIDHVIIFQHLRPGITSKCAQLVEELQVLHRIYIDDAIICWGNQGYCIDEKIQFKWLSLLRYNCRFEIDCPLPKQCKKHCRSQPGNGYLLQTNISVSTNIAI